MRLGFGFAIGLIAATALTPPAPARPAIESIDAVGWSARWADLATLPAYSTGGSEFDPETAPIVVPVIERGYDATAQLRTDIVDSVIVTRRVRQPFTGAANTHLLGDGARVALNRPVLATTIVPGAVNNSTRISPKPIAQWQRRNRRVARDTLRVEVVAGHWSARDGKPVAAVTAYATDGTMTTAPVVMTGPVVLPSSTDKHAVIGYYADLDVASLAPGVFTVHGRAYPRLGDAASVLDTAGGALDGRGFVPQSFFKPALTPGGIDKVATPPLAYVSLTGTDATVDATGAAGGVVKVSTDAAVAGASPFATIKSAVEALKAATSVTSGWTDGCIVRLMAGSHAMTNTLAGTYQQGGELIIESDPALGAARASITAANINFRQSWLTYRRLNLVRASASQFTALAGGRVAIEDCTLDNGGQASAFWGVAPIAVNGLTIVNQGLSTLINASAGLQANMLRGVSAGQPNGAAFNVEAYNCTGCRFGNATFVFGGRDPSGGVLAFYSNMGRNSGTALSLTVAGINAVSGFLHAQGIQEFTSSVSNPTTRVSADNEAPSITQYLHWNVSYGGASLYGRENSGYDETVGTYRAHEFWSEAGVIYTARYTKHDWFVGTSGGAAAAEAQMHVNGWSVLYGVGAEGNLHQYPTFAGAGPGGGPGGSENMAYYGRGSKASTGQLVRLDPKFVGGVTKATQFDGTTATAGTGGAPEDYRLESGSPARGILPSARLPFDLAGAQRSPVNDSAGAYA